MLLNQTYNAEGKEESGLDGITLNAATRTKWMKWMYMKHATAAISTQLKSVLHLNSSNLYHVSGKAHVSIDAEALLGEMAAINISPFTTTTTALVKI